MMIEKVTKPRQGYDDVMSVDEYYDGPRKGTANFRSIPCYFECVFDKNCDEYSDWFLLTPLGPKALKAAMEKWQIFLRWRTAFDLGKTSLETHPALPRDKDKYSEAKRALDNALVSNEQKRIRAKGEFGVLGNSPLPRDILTRWQVKWTEL
jgi:hypothetical protein